MYKVRLLNWISAFPEDNGSEIALLQHEKDKIGSRWMDVLCVMDELV